VSPQNTPPPLFTQRALIIFIVAIIVGLIVGGLTFASTGNPWTAVIAGLTAFGVTLMSLPRHVA
jgi:hypothetical protein